ncbi:MAG: hypothetical protein ABSA59_18155, partial [Terriglobia bacterium]
LSLDCSTSNSRQTERQGLEEARSTWRDPQIRNQILRAQDSRRLFQGDFEVLPRQSLLTGVDSF